MQEGSEKLNPRQVIFIREYLIDSNATRAYRAAGYKAKTDNVAAVCANQLIRKPKISVEVARVEAERLERHEITADRVLKGIQEIIERCMQQAPVFDKKGNHVFTETPNGEMAPAYTFNALGALKGYELLGKHLKLFTEKLEHTGKDGKPSDNRVFLIFEKGEKPIQA